MELLINKFCQTLQCWYVCIVLNMSVESLSSIMEFGLMLIKIFFFVFALSGQTTKMVEIFQVLPYAYGIIL